MVEVGELVIKGSLDTTDVKRGQREISSGFDTVKQKTQSTFSSMDLLANSAGKLGDALVTVSTAAVGGLTLLAGLTPVLAPEFAKLKTETFKLAQIFGTELKPAFEIATDAYTGFVNFLSQDTGLANFSKDLITLTAAGGGLTLLSSKLLGIKNLGKIIIPITLAYTITKNIDELAGLGQTGGESVAENVFGLGPGTFTYGAFGKAGNIFGGTAAGAATGALIGSLIPGVGTVIGGAVGGVGGFGYSTYQVVRDEFFNDVDASGRP